MRLGDRQYQQYNNTAIVHRLSERMQGLVLVHRLRERLRLVVVVAMGGGEW